MSPIRKIFHNTTNKIYYFLAIDQMMATVMTLLVVDRGPNVQTFWKSYKNTSFFHHHHLQRPHAIILNINTNIKTRQRIFSPFILSLGDSQKYFVSFLYVFNDFRSFVCSKINKVMMDHYHKCWSDVRKVSMKKMCGGWCRFESLSNALLMCLWLGVMCFKMTL